MSSMYIPDKVTVVEVGPRDGFQSHQQDIPTDLKVEIIDRLSETGLPKIEATAFVHPKMVPQLRDAAEVMKRIRRKPGVVYRALVPNEKGALRAREAGVDEMLGLITVSETYTMKNQNMTVDQVIDQIAKVVKICDDSDIALTMAVGICFHCPYEGTIPPEQVEAVFSRLYDLGIVSFYIADSLGLANPRSVSDLAGHLLGSFPDIDLGFHIHNTNGLALANLLAALDAGVTSVEGSICGMGGGIRIPEAMPAPGNAPTEDIVQMLDEMGVQTGVSLTETVKTAKFVKDRLGLTAASYVLAVGTQQEILAATRA